MVEFKVNFDSRVTRKMTEYQTDKSLKSTYKMMPLFLILGAIFIAVSFLNSKNSGFDYFLFGLGLFLIIFILLFPIILKSTIKNQQRMIENNNTLMGNQTEEIYKFDEEKVFIFTNKGKKYRSAVETDYDYFCYVIEDENSFMLFISNVQCHVIFKDCLTNGSLEEFKEILSKHFSGAKYILKQPAKHN